jgi:hypothetical protein
MTDRQKGWILVGTGFAGYLFVWLLVGNRFSVIYGIPAIPLIWGRILLTIEPGERQARPVFKILGIVLIVLFVCITVIGAIIEIIHYIR